LAILALSVKLFGCLSWICWLASYDAYDGWLDIVAILVGCLMMVVMAGWLIWQTCMAVHAGWLSILLVG
jgi:hypothetical protein